MNRKTPVSTRLRRRAEKSINSDAYEQDTRDAVKQALKEGDGDYLTETVRHAERGDHICDTTLIDREQLRQAKLVIAFLDSSAPDFITTAAQRALEHAARLKRIDIWRGPEWGEHLDPQSIADLIAILGPVFSLPVEQPDPRTEAAALLSRVVKHEGLPADLRNEIGQLITETLMGSIDQDAPEMLAAALELYERA